MTDWTTMLLPHHLGHAERAEEAAAEASDPTGLTGEPQAVLVHSRSRLQFRDRHLVEISPYEVVTAKNDAHRRLRESQGATHRSIPRPAARSLVGLT